MDLIAEYAYVLTEGSQKNLELSLPKRTKMRKLYDLVVHEKVDDQTAAKILYKTKPSDKRYLMLKRNLSQKLAEVFILNSLQKQERVNYLDIQAELTAQLVVASRFLDRNVFHNADKILRKTLAKAEKYSLLGTEVQVLLKLREMYSMQGFPDKCQEVISLLQSKMQQYMLLQEIEGMEQLLDSKVKFSTHKTKDMLNLCEDCVARAEEIAAQYDNPFIRLILYYLQAMRAYVNNRFDEYGARIDDLEELFKNESFVFSNIRLLRLYFHHAQYYRSLRKVEEAIGYAKWSLELTEYKAYNRFDVQFLLTDLALKKRAQTEALSICEEVMQVEQYAFLHAVDQAKWLVYFYYAQLDWIVNHPGAANYAMEGVEEIFHKRFPARRDKHGRNIQVLILKPFVEIFQQGTDYDLINIAHNMQVYRHRHLKDISEVRTMAFYDLLIEACLMNFDLSYRQQIVNRFAEMVEDYQYFDELEVVPYAQLLDMGFILAEQAK